MFKLRTIGHFVLRAGSLQASPPAPGVRAARRRRPPPPGAEPLQPENPKSRRTTAGRFPLEMVPMMASLVAACVMIVIFASVIVALGDGGGVLAAARRPLVPGPRRLALAVSDGDEEPKPDHGWIRGPSMPRGCRRRSPTDLPTEQMR